MLRTRLSVCYLPIEQLKPDPRNARVHTKKQVRQIASSIESFGFNVPILIDGGNHVVAGHGRILAAKLLGLAEVPTVRLDHLTGAPRRAFATADTRLTEIASWDDRLLGETLQELASVDLDFALEATGFDAGEIDLRIEALPQNEREPAERPIPAVPGPAVTRTGDLWLLGRHKVLCGDALDAEAYRTLLGPETANAAFTDPPYNLPIDGHVSGRGQTRHREFPMAAGEMDPAAFAKFLETSLRHMAAFSRPGAVHYVCMDWRHAAELLIASRTAGLDMLNLCVWTKPNAGLGSFYRSQHELVFVFKAGPGRHQNNVQLGRQGRNRSNVWAYAAGRYWPRLFSNSGPDVKLSKKSLPGPRFSPRSGDALRIMALGDFGGPMCEARFALLGHRRAWDGLAIATSRQGRLFPPSGGNFRGRSRRLRGRCLL